MPKEELCFDVHEPEQEMFQACLEVSIFPMQIEKLNGSTKISLHVVVDILMVFCIFSSKTC
jgi:hypothetical protein